MIGFFNFALEIYRPIVEYQFPRLNIRPLEVAVRCNAEWYILQVASSVTIRDF